MSAAGLGFFFLPLNCEQDRGPVNRPGARDLDGREAVARPPMPDRGATADVGKIVYCKNFLKISFFQKIIGRAHSVGYISASNLPGKRAQGHDTMDVSG
jgi:hypothetical protein